MKIGFNKLAKRVHREEHGKPIYGKLAKHIERTQGREAAERYIGNATAAKVYHEQQRHSGCIACRAGIKHMHIR